LKIPINKGGFMPIKQRLKHILSKLPFYKYIEPAWPDEARLISQGHTFKQLMGENYLFGECLNAGCGEGLYSSFLESYSEISKITNLDLALPDIQNQRLDKRHNSIQGSLTSLPFNNNSFDCCLCSEVVEHIEEDTVAISELARVLRYNGLLLISVPTPPAPYDPAHVREGYTMSELSELLTSNGLMIIHYTNCFYISMRVLFYIWRYQANTIGKNGKNYFPRLLMISLSYLDRYLKLGKPWDLVILAKKSE
jgi:2-polyprenyl-3-methyl-5-hydroxy-6-metoxy-1,4-benzoquinol methylase